MPHDFRSWHPPEPAGEPSGPRPRPRPQPSWGRLGDSELEEVARQARERRAARYAARSTLLGRVRLSRPRPPRGWEAWQGLGRGRRLLALASLAVLAAAAALFVLPWLKVQRVQVVGDPVVGRAQLLAEAGVRTGQSTLLVDGAAITRNLLALPWMASAQVTVRWPDALSVRVTPLPPALQYRRGTQTLALAASGALLGGTAQVGGLPVLVDQRQLGAARPGQLVLPTRLARALVQLGAAFPKAYGVSVRQFVIDRVGALEIQSSAGWTADLGLALTQAQIASLGPKLEALRALSGKVDLKGPGIKDIYLEDPAQVVVSP
ncbi:MAG: cell division protein FtsQ/DivIB [Candidatus Dormibacteria bacterium]